MQKDTLTGLGFWLLLLFSVSCRNVPVNTQVLTSDAPFSIEAKSRMKAVIQKRTFFNNMPSGSGLEQHNGFFYVIGDDSPFLYTLDKDYNLLDRHALTDTAGFETGRVAKAVKADLEGLTKIEVDGQPCLLMLGSGATPARNQAFVVQMPAAGAAPVVTSYYSLEALYLDLRQNEEVIGDGLLNIEGVAAGAGKLYLLQRAIGSNRNVLITFELQEFIEYLRAGAGASMPAYSLSFFRLPIMGVQEAGFSGAYFYDDKLFFTASIESTTDAVADGTILGSYIGFIPLQQLAADTVATTVAPAGVITRQDGAVYSGKVESLVILESSSRNRRFRILAVTDDDRGNSELLEISLRLQP
ncbi:DUF6929 family protein [Pontibacter beigongshangensis]|uniref:DUF6929 family protein n=1 Tax=Pontibacter beigongshangensis TaxID=2574733 RepID=UPI001F507456|nr:hypothetical protein [Pontibacter beigongshangensis]